MWGFLDRFVKMSDLFRGVLWPREKSSDGKYRCVIIGMMVSDEPFNLPNQALVSCNANALVEAVRVMPFEKSDVPLGTANEVLTGLNQYPFVK